MVKNSPAMQETWIRSPGQEDPLEKEIATHSSILGWKIPWMEKPGGLQFITSSTGTEAEELERSTRREDPGLHLKPSPCPLQYLLQVRAQNTHSEDYAEALELQVVVTDENDNAPICPPRGPSVSIPELSPPGVGKGAISCPLAVRLPGWSPAQASLP